MAANRFAFFPIEMESRAGIITWPRVLIFLADPDFSEVPVLQSLHGSGYERQSHYVVNVSNDTLWIVKQRIARFITQTFSALAEQGKIPAEGQFPTNRTSDRSYKFSPPDL